MEMSKENVQAKQETILDSFKAAGIGARYWNKNMSLADYGHAGVEIKSSIKQVVALAKSGNGISFIGNKEAFDVMALTCRSLVRRGVHVRMLSIFDLKRFIIDNDIYDERAYASFRSAQVIAVDGFFDARFERLGNEISFYLDLWMRDCIKDGRTLFVHSTHPIERTSTWWSDLLIAILCDYNASYTFCKKELTSASSKIVDAGRHRTRHSP